MENQVGKVTKLLRNKKRGITWPFCRLFDDTPLCDLSNGNCPEISIIGALIKMGDYNKAEELQQFSRIKSLFPSMKKYADCINSVLRPEVQDSTSCKEALAVLKHLKRLEGSSIPPR